MKRGQVSIEMIYAVVAMIIILAYFLYTAIDWQTELSNSEKDVEIRQTCENIRQFLTATYNSLDGYYSAINVTTNYRITAYKTTLIVVHAENPYNCNFKGIIKECDMAGDISEDVCNITSSGILEAWNKDGYIYLKFTPSGDEIPTMTTMTTPTSTTSTSTTTTSTSTTTTSTTTTSTMPCLVTTFNNGKDTCECDMPNGYCYMIICGDPCYCAYTIPTCDDCSFTIPKNAVINKTEMTVSGLDKEQFHLIYEEYPDIVGGTMYSVYADENYIYFTVFFTEKPAGEMVHVLNKTDFSRVATLSGCVMDVQSTDKYVFNACNSEVRVLNRSTLEYYTTLPEAWNQVYDLGQDASSLYMSEYYSKLRVYDKNNLSYLRYQFAGSYQNSPNSLAVQPGAQTNAFMEGNSGNSIRFYPTGFQIFSPPSGYYKSFATDPNRLYVGVSGVRGSIDTYDTQTMTKINETQTVGQGNCEIIKDDNYFILSSPWVVGGSGYYCGAYWARVYNKTTGKLTQHLNYYSNKMFIDGQYLYTAGQITSYFEGSGKIWQKGPSWTIDPTVDVLNDGSKEFQYVGQFKTSGTLSDFTNSVKTYCAGQPGNCTVPMRATTKEAGRLVFSNLCIRGYVP